MIRSIIVIVALSRNRKKRPNSPYGHVFRSNTVSTVGKKGAPIRNGLKVIIFWVIFFIFISFLFLINGERIRTTIRNAHFPVWFSEKDPPEQTSTNLPDQEVSVPAENFPVSAGDKDEIPTLAQERSRAEEPASRENAQEEPSFSPLPSTGVVQEPLNPESAGTEPPVSNQAAWTATPTQSRPEVAARTRSLYFIQVDPEGTIQRLPVSRTLPVSASPLGDVLQALLDGPSPEEQGQGLISLIPAGTRIRSVIIRLETAYVNLSEEFLYTPYGSEGYTAQLAQLVWTATEFPSVKDVQVLIEGRKMDYLGDITWIGSPIGRDSF
jgi:spore germination protein GerM